jgi:hypothetical protein
MVGLKKMPIKGLRKINLRKKNIWDFSLGHIKIDTGGKVKHFFAT